MGFREVLLFPAFRSAGDAPLSAPDSAGPLANLSNHSQKNINIFSLVQEIHALSTASPCSFLACEG